LGGFFYFLRYVKIGGGNMKKPYWVVIITSLFLTGCISSEKAIQNAIAETQAEIGK